MASRRIYLTLATILRGNASPIDEHEYIHSWLSQRLRLGVVESSIALSARLGYLSAIAALYGNSAANVDKGCEHVNKLYLDTLSSVPYFTESDKSSAVSGDVDASVEAWRRMVAAGELDAD